MFWLSKMTYLSFTKLLSCFHLDYIGQPIPCSYTPSVAKNTCSTFIFLHKDRKHDLVYFLSDVHTNCSCLHNKVDTVPSLEYTHTHTHNHAARTNSCIPSHKLLPKPPAPVIQIYELTLATICYNPQQCYYTWCTCTKIWMDTLTLLDLWWTDTFEALRKFADVACLTFRGDVASTCTHACCLPTMDASEGHVCRDRS